MPKQLLLMKNLKWKHLLREPLWEVPHFLLNEHDHIALLGPSGSGKSALLRFILQLPETAEDFLKLDGQIIWKGQEQKQLGKLPEIAYLSQNASELFYENLTIEEHLQLFLEHSQKENFLDSLDILGLSRSSIKAYPRQLSLGTLQRLALLVVLARRNLELLILDEPLTGLDPLWKEYAIFFLQKNIKERSLSLLLVSHDEALSYALVEYSYRIEDHTLRGPYENFGLNKISLSK